MTESRALLTTYEVWCGDPDGILGEQRLRTFGDRGKPDALKRAEGYRERLPLTLRPLAYVVEVSRKVVA